ncbi:MAG TPA: hypothetical protein DHN33_06785, partial [Eubacteriaceae bacterium]|nr:hypothetical protein [Eubacteriaceae bacterium]
MPFDGFTVHHIVEELKQNLLQSRIQKIHQPEKDELVFVFSANRKKQSVLFSASHNHPRIHFTEEQRKNPSTAPVFCMLLRKKLTNGLVTDIRQIGFDRIIEFDILSKDELFEKTKMKLIVEIMGRHSNIILVENEIITDSIKRINTFLSSYREVLPGKPYKLPPIDKNDLSSLSSDQMREIISSQPEKSVANSIFSSFQGFSKGMGQEVCMRCNIPDAAKIKDLTDRDFQCIHQEFHTLIQPKEKGGYLFYKKDDSFPVDFAPCLLTIYKDYHSEEKETLSQAIEQFYKNKDAGRSFQEMASALKQSIHTRLERDYNKLNNLREDLDKSQKALSFKEYGDLLLANLYSLDENSSEAQVHDFYNDRPITIPLDPTKSPSDNAKEYYEKYNKAKRAQSHIQEQLKRTKEEIYYFESVLDSIEKTDEIENLEEIKEELIKNDYLKKHRGSKKKQKKTAESKPIQLSTSSGFLLRVGKNN